MCKTSTRLFVFRKDPKINPWTASTKTSPYEAITKVKLTLIDMFFFFGETIVCML